MVVYVFLIIVLYLVYFLPNTLLDFLLGNQDVVYQNKDGAITFTFDDSPSDHTNDILDCLQDYNIKAIFFVLSDKIKGKEHILDRIINEGHRIGNHGTKDRIHVLQSARDFETDLLECEAKLERWGRTNYFRPGFGFFNTSMLATLQKHGYTLMLGNVFPYDTHIRLPTVNAWYIRRKWNKGSIIVLHEREWTVATLRKVFDGVNKQLVP